MRHLSFFAAIAVLVNGCAAETQRPQLPDHVEEVSAATIQDMPRIAPNSLAPDVRAAVDRGEYLVELLGCGTCHTNGALIGEPDTAMSLAGSQIGIAYVSPFQSNRPGVIFAPNITPDVATGIGDWSDAQLDAAIRQGAGRHGTSRIAAMPWPGYAKLSDADATAIVAYLKNLPPVAHRVPANVRPGEKTDETYVYFGFYRSTE